MTGAEAVEAMRAKWDHPPTDARDIEERIAIRFRDLDHPPPFLVQAGRVACRVFYGDKVEGYRSAYVHHPREVDGVIDRLLERADK